MRRSGKFHSMQKAKQVLRIKLREIENSKKQRVTQSVYMTLYTGHIKGDIAHE